MGLSDVLIRLHECVKEQSNWIGRSSLQTLTQILQILLGKVTKQSTVCEHVQTAYSVSAFFDVNDCVLREELLHMYNACMLKY